MRSYEDLFHEIIHDGVEKKTRQGVKTVSLHGAMLTHDFKDGFPLLTSKKINFHNIIVETLWYLRGEPHIKFLQENGVHIWDHWADVDGYIGPTYSYQWKSFNGHKLFNQIDDVIKSLKTNPESRRIIIAGWNPIQLDEMRLPPCITQLQFLSNDGKLDLIVTQRSADFAVGVPYDIAEMALLQLIIATLTEHSLGKLKFMYGDVHIYQDHLEGLKKQMQRPQYDLPYVHCDPYSKYEKIEDFVIDSFQLVEYEHGPFIKYKVHV